MTHKSHRYAAGKPFISGHAPVYKVVTMEGYEIELTKEHNLMTENGEWVQIGKMIPGTKIRLQNHPPDQIGSWESCDGKYAEGYAEGVSARLKHTVSMRIEGGGIYGYDVEYYKTIEYCLGFVHGFILSQCTFGKVSYIECVSPLNPLLQLVQRILLRLNILSVIVDRYVHESTDSIESNDSFLQIKTCYDRMSCSIFCVNN